MIKGIALKLIMLNAWAKMLPFWQVTIIGVVVSCFPVYLSLYYEAFRYICFTFAGLVHIYAFHTTMKIGRLKCFWKICSCSGYHLRICNILLLNTLYIVWTFISRVLIFVKNAWEGGVISSSTLRDFTF